MGSAMERAFELAREQYAGLGVDVGAAMETLKGVPVSLHCWQGDDVGGFETSAGLTGGGIQATGNYPGKARTADELRADLEEAFKLIPGKHRVNLHAIYAETDGGGEEGGAGSIVAGAFFKVGGVGEGAGIGVGF